AAVAREKGDAEDAAGQRLPAEQVVQLVAQVGSDRPAQRLLGEVVAAELVGAEACIGPDLPLGAKRRLVAGEPAAEDGGEDEGDPGVEPETEDQPRRAAAFDRAEGAGRRRRRNAGV